MVVIFIIIVLFILALYQHFFWKAEEWPHEAIQVPSFQAHRGFWKNGAQENTMEAFFEASRRGWLMAELDVQLSKDQIPVVFHDLDLNRLASINKIVAECTAAELKILAQAPSLEEVLKSQKVPQKINIELKTDKMLNGQLELEVAKVVRRCLCERKVLISSFNPFSLWRISKHLPQVPRVLLATQEVESGNWFYLRYLCLAPYVKIHGLNLDYRFVTAAQLKKWRKRKIPITLWTVNEPEVAEKYLDAGAVSIISDSILDNRVQH